MIRRLLFVLLLALIPIQTSWAAAGSYCRHESGAAAQHFGHHDHQHHPLVAECEDEPAKSPMQPHADCAACHLNCPAATSAPSLSIRLSGAFPVSDPPHPLASIIPEEPERPKWVRSA